MGAIVLKRFIVVFLEFELVCPLLRYKDLRLIHLDIIGTDKYTALLQSLEQLAQVWCQEAACFVHCTLYKFIVELIVHVHCTSVHIPGERTHYLLPLLLQSWFPRT